MAATEDKFWINKAKSVIGSHWGKDETIQMSLARCLPKPLDGVSGIQANIEPTNPKKIELHRLIANHAWARVYHIDMVYSKHTCVESTLLSFLDLPPQSHSHSQTLTVNSLSFFSASGFIQKLGPRPGLGFEKAEAAKPKPMYLSRNKPKIQINEIQEKFDRLLCSKLEGELHLESKQVGTW